MGDNDYWNSIDDYGHGKSNDPDYGPVPEEYLSTSMSKAAMICGFLSLVCVIFNVFGSLVFGSLGLLFAFLSKRSKMSRQARLGARLSVIGLVLFAGLMAFSAYTLISTGVWDRMMEAIREMDPNDPDAVGQIQQDVIRDLEQQLLGEYYGIGQSGATPSAPKVI